MICYFGLRTTPDGRHAEYKPFDCRGLHYRVYPLFDDTAFLTCDHCHRVVVCTVGLIQDIYDARELFRFHMHAELVIGQMASGYLDYAEIKNRAYQAEILVNM